MGNSYYQAEKAADKVLEEKRKKQEIQKLEKKIIELRENQDEDGFSAEQLLLIEYYGLTQDELEGNNFDFSNTEPLKDKESQVPKEEMESIRYYELLDMFSKIKEFDEKEVNALGDIFHKYITSWYDFGGDFEQEPLIVQKMRNLQMLNRMAHHYQTLFKTILYAKNPEIDQNYTESDKRRIENYIEELYSDAHSAEETRLAEKFGINKVNEWKNDKAMRYCVQASRWSFKQKQEYLKDVLKDLQNTTGEYNYGVLGDAFAFDVPGYGQFCVHMGKKNNSQQFEEVQELYEVGQYEGMYLGDVYILSKAEPELLEDVNYEELSDSDKQRYDIARLGILEPEIEPPKEVLEEDVEVESDNLIEEIGNNEQPEEQNESNYGYQEIREMTNNIIEEQQNIEDIKLIISELKAQKSELKQKIKQMNEEINEKILDSDEPTVEVIQDIIELRNTVKQLEDMRKAVKKMIKRYKENKKEMKKTLKLEIDDRNRAVDEIEL